MAVSPAEYRRALGNLADELSPHEIEQAYNTSERLASALFDSWANELHKTNAQIAPPEVEAV